MDILDNDTIIVTDEEGNEQEVEILFTFESDEGKKYVLYFDPKEEEPYVNASIYDDEGGLFPVESVEEWDMIEEVFNTFMAEDELEG